MENNKIKRHSFSRISCVLDMPDLLEIQLKSYLDFLQQDTPPGKRENKGLQSVFKSIFPIVDTRENYILEFTEYYVNSPKYSMVECQERGVTYSVPLKAKLRLSARDEEGSSKEFSHTIEQDVYLGNLPYMTDRGTFIINGAERVIVNQLHRSPGVFFDSTQHPNGTQIYSGRVIPLRGAWIEFTTDINDIMYVYIDRRKKFHVTTLLRAIGFSSDSDILNIFGSIDEVDIKSSKVEKYYNRKIVEEVVNTETGEIIAEKDSNFTPEISKAMSKEKIRKVKVLKYSSPSGSMNIIANTMMKDVSKSTEDALETIYRQLRSGDAPDLETARNLIDRLFFNPKKYDLDKVGRYRLNKKLNLNVDLSVTVLTNEDIISIIKYLLDLKAGKKDTDDIDHLGNRRVKTVGEQLAAQFSIGLARMARTIKERMNLRDSETLTPQDLVNARTISSVINTFFGTSQLSQFMDQTNPLSELTHKRRLSALGPGGLTRERAGFEVRDVHYTHYGRLCPIETPEGPNIGLISSMCIFARVNELGFIETPYRKKEGNKVTDKIVYLTADDEENYFVAQASAPLNSQGRFINDKIKTRVRGDFPVVAPKDVDFMDVAPCQITSAAAALIPFLEHDDANRALMGSNMQRQSVPLLKPETPFVGTGLESKVARDSRTMIISKTNGTIVKVSATEIVVENDEAETEDLKFKILKFEDSKYTRYELKKFFRTNQDTCINQRPIVKVGDRVKVGDVLADGCATDRGELALGRNIIVAFLSWKGYNFEDAIIVSEGVICDDLYTSVHIEEFELRVRDTKRGEEVLTREIPNVSEESTKDLSESGIIRVGAEVNAGDIIVGKVTPKGETDPTPEEKLLKAIFGDKAGDVKDASLKAPPGMQGIVVDTKLFSRKNKDSATRKEDKKKVDQIEKELKKMVETLNELRDDKLYSILLSKKANEIKSLDGGKKLLKSGRKLTLENLKKIDFSDVNPDTDWTDDSEANELVRRIYEEYNKKLGEYEEEYKKKKYKIMVGDELPPGIVQLAKVYIVKKRKLSVGDKMAGRHGNKGVIAKVVPIEDMPYLPDGRVVDIVLNPLGVPSRMNLGQIFETALGMAAKKLGIYYSTPVFDGATIEEVKNELKKAGFDEDGKTVLYDGQTGEPFDQRITVGYIYMMKLAHLVDDKIHARSIGPYSLITQQPLGGKAQFGGQRFGEMEVWSLEAYGAAHTLQEILTVKSDDVNGRAKVYEAIVKGENLPETGIPESFNVLFRELQGLCLDIRAE